MSFRDKSPINIPVFEGENCSPSLPPAAPDASGTIHRKLNDSNVSGAMQYAFVWYKIDKVAFYKGTERFLSGGAGAFLVSFQLVTNSCVG